MVVFRAGPVDCRSSAALHAVTMSIIILFVFVNLPLLHAKCTRESPQAMIQPKLSMCCGRRVELFYRLVSFLSPRPLLGATSSALPLLKCAILLDKLDSKVAMGTKYVQDRRFRND